MPVGAAYEFANDLVHEVLYASTPAPVRRLHHRRAADLLAATPEAVGAHAAAAGDWPRAARALLLAGEAAARRGAMGDAESLHDRALAAAERVADLEIVGRVLLARAGAREGLERHEEAWTDLRSAAQAAREAGDRRLEMAVLRQLGGDVPIALGIPPAECVTYLRGGLRRAATLGDRVAEADLRGRLAVLATNDLRFGEALEQGRRAVAVARETGGDRALLVGLDGLKTAYAYAGMVDELAEVVDELEPLARRLRHRGLLQWAVFEGSFPAVAAGRWDEAAGAHRRGDRGDASTRLRRPRRLVPRPPRLGRAPARATSTRRCTSGGGRWRAAGEAGHRWWTPTACSLLAATLLERGSTEDVAEARTVAGRGLALAGRDGAAACRVRCLAPLAEIAAGHGDDTPLVEADSLLAGVTAPPAAAWLLGADAYVSVARAWLARDRPARARRTLAPLLAAARAHGWSHLAERVAGSGPSRRPGLSAV